MTHFLVLFFNTATKYPMLYFLRYFLIYVYVEKKISQKGHISMFQLLNPLQKPTIYMLLQGIKCKCNIG